MLGLLRERGCTLVEKEWVKNHWAQVVWKLAGLARIPGEETKGKWCWEEASRQMLYRCVNSSTFFLSHLSLISYSVDVVLTDTNARSIVPSAPQFDSYKNTMRPPREPWYYVLATYSFERRMKSKLSLPMAGTGFVRYRTRHSPEPQKKGNSLLGGRSRSPVPEYV